MSQECDYCGADKPLNKFIRRKGTRGLIYTAEAVTDICKPCGKVIAAANFKGRKRIARQLSLRAWI